jgi:hypothetical protein
MKPISESVVAVLDHGLFFHVARRLARDCKKVFYWTPSERAFPVIREANIGGGFEDVERIEDFWAVKDQIDFFMFPDIGFAGLQAELKSQGFPVWGCGCASDIESYRGKFMKTLESVGLQAPPFEAIKGMSKLREFLKDKTDRWIKMSKWRGDWETVHWRDWAQDQMTLVTRETQIGPMAEELTYYVFEPIDTTIEDGSDAWFCGGKFPDRIIHGVEAKDKAYLGTFTDFDKLPKPVLDANSAIAPVLKECGYNGFFSTEVRVVSEDDFYFTDPTCRCGSPPSQVMTEMLENFSEIVQAGAHGICLEAVEAADFGMQAMVKIKRNPATWGTATIPDELDQWFKPTPCMKTKDGVLCFPPDEENVAGWLVAIGDTIQECADLLNERIGKLPDGLESDMSPMKTLIEEIEALHEQDMEFTAKEVPDPQFVI